MLKIILIIGFLVSPCYSQVQQITNTKGQIDSIALRSVLDDIDGTKVNKNDISSIKMIIISSTTAGKESDNTSLAHGLDGSKIRGAQVVVDEGGGIYMPPHFTNVAENEYDVYWGATVFVVALSATNSGNIVNKPYTILIFYVD